jgi:hypothetical protein
MLAGPMLRNRKFFRIGSLDWLIIGAAAAWPPPCAPSDAVANGMTRTDSACQPRWTLLGMMNRVESEIHEKFMNFQL